MNSQFLFLLCFGLCVGQTDISGDGPLCQPSLSAWPSSVAPAQSNVTLRCTSPTPGESLILRKGAILFHTLSPNQTEGTAEFHLTELRQSDAGPYTCHYNRKGLPDTMSQPNDVLLLLVTGNLPKPSLQAHQPGKVTAGGEVTLRCQKPENMTEYKTFDLLKEGALSLTRHSTNDSVDFSLHYVTVSDTGNYSCVYHQTEAPFWASHPSDPLEVLVTEWHPSQVDMEQDASPSTVSEYYTKGNLIRLGLAAMFTMIMMVFLVEAWHSHRESQSRPRNI